jgi:hypothetical protein
MSLNFDAQRTAQSELKAGENLLWVGQPDPLRYALQGTLPTTLFGFVFTAGPLFLAFINGSFPVGLMIFLLIGLVIMSVPLWAYRDARQTVYAVTDKRLLIITGGGSPSVQSFDDSSFGSIGKIEPVERSNGSGDIVFSQKVHRYRDSDGHSCTSIEPIGFFGIPDVRSVEKLVRGVAPRNAR